MGFSAETVGHLVVGSLQSSTSCMPYTVGGTLEVLEFSDIEWG